MMWFNRHQWFGMLTVLVMGCSAAWAGVIATPDRLPTIIHPDGMDAETRRGVSILQDVSQKAMDKPWPALPESRAQAIQGPRIYVGRSGFVDQKIGGELDKRGPDAIAIITQGDTLILAGKTPFASTSAVTEFVRRHMGVEWYMPGPLFEVVPRTSRVEVADGEYWHEPSYRARQASGINNRMNTHANAAWFNMQRYMPRYSFHHSGLATFPPEKYGHQPEMYALVNGKRMVPGKGSLEGWQVCMTHPAVIDAYVAQGEALAGDSNSPRLSISVSPNDGRYFCECENCAKFIKPDAPEKQSATPLVFHLVNEVARRLQKTAPHVLVGIMSYSDYREPTPDLQVEPNVVLYLVGHRNSLPSEDPLLPAGYDYRIEAWKKAGVKHFGIYEWYNGAPYNVPPIYVTAIANAMKYGHRNGADGLYTEAYPSWGLQGPSHWIVARLAWDINQDVDQLMDQYCRDLFGPAASSMRAYFDLCEKSWNGAEVPFASLKQYEAYPLPVRKALQKHLDEAMALTQSDPVMLERVSFFHKAFGFSQRMADAYEQGIKGEEAYDKGDIAGALAALADPSSDADPIAYMRTVCDPIPLMLFYKSDDLNMYVLSAIKRKLETKIKIAGPLISQAGRETLAQGHPTPQAYQQHLSASVAKGFGSADAQAGSTLQSIEEYSSKAVFAPRVDAPPRIDGDFEDDVWADVPEYANFYAYGGGVPAAYETRFKIIAHKDRIYLAATCFQDMTNPRAGGTVRDSNVWLDDAIEIFLNLPDEDRPDHFVQVIANINGVVFDWYRKDKGWNPDIQVATRRDKDHWRIEMSIPLADVGMSPDQVQGLRVNVVRDVFGPGPGKPSQISAWFPTTFGHSDPSLRGWLFFTRPQ